MTYPRNAVSAAGHSAWYSYSMTVDKTVIGSFAKFGASSTRTVERVRNILQSQGAQVIDMVWGGTDTTITLEYAQLFQKNIYEAMGFYIYALEDMNFAFDIVETMTDPSLGSKHVITYEACVASKWGRDLDVTGTKVIETMDVEVARVSGEVTSG